MPEGVGADAFLNVGFLRRFFDRSLQAGGVEMVAAFLPAAGVGGAFGRGKEVLPGEFAAGIGVFCFEGIGEVDFAAAGSEVFFVEEANTFDLTLQVGDDDAGQGDDAVFFAFAIAHRDAFVLKVNILDTQADAFHQAQAGAVEQLRHEFVNSVHEADDAEDFFAAEDGGEAFGAFCGRKEDGFDFLVQNFTVKEKDGRERLVLGGGGDGTFRSEVNEEGLDFRSAHFVWVTFLVEEYVTPCPIQVGFLRAVGVMLGAQGVAHLVEEFFCHRRLTWGWIQYYNKNDSWLFLRFRLKAA